jgi:UDP-glucose 4-epimerase
MRILVTGGAGFIGSNVVDRYVALGHEVAVLDNLSSGFRAFVHPKARLIEADVTDAAAVERAFAGVRPEILNHHAAQIDVRRSVSDPVFDATVNVLGGLRLLEACTRHGVRKVIYASTGGALYGEGRQLPATEDHPVNPEAPYGASKHALEHYLYLWRMLHRLDFTVLRYPNVFGPRQNPHGEAGVNAIFIGLMLERKRPKIFGTGEQVRDYLYVDDVVAANVAALERGSGAMLNLGTGVGTSVLDIVRELNAILGTAIEPVFEAARPGEIQRIYLDATRAREALGWAPATAFRDGLRKTVEWSRANPLPATH